LLMLRGGRCLGAERNRLGQRVKGDGGGGARRLNVNLAWFGRGKRSD
jgi:hypothetical protein